MHKWKLFKKSAALVLSSAVIASGVPVTAMASEAEVFSDVSEETQGDTAQEEGESEDRESVSQDQPEVGEADIQSEEPEESDAESYSGRSSRNFSRRDSTGRGVADPG